MKQQTGLYTKILTIVIISLLSVITLLLFFVYTGLRQTLHIQLANRGSEITSYISTLGSEDILLENDYALLQLINKVKKSNNDVRYIIVADYKGRILAHTFSAQYPLAMPKKITSASNSPDVKLFRSNEGTIHQIITPLDNGKIGFICIGLSDKSTQKLLLSIITNFSLTGIIITILAVFTIGLLLAKILAPIRFLSLAAEKIKNNNYKVKVYYQGNDELGTLTQTFNEMTQDLAQKASDNKKLLTELKEKDHSRDILIHKLFSAQEDERKRISRELHDGIGQSVTSILAYLRILLNNETNARQQKLIQSTRTIIASVLDELREMAVNLRPPSLDDIDIITIFRQHVYDTAKHNGLIAEFEADESIKDIELSDNIRLALYRILQEACTNIVYHAHAINIKVTLALSDSNIIMQIADDGCGFSEEVLQTAREKRHLGLYGMQERVELLDGNFKIKSQPDKGTTIIISIPFEKRVSHE
ncbi:sensor histidine kinase [Pectinatus brassicae]|uniref:histidine kinase n=1 Tax=Pectinatus brassicae TaxID=862415 RepID=A0A840UQB4_9FIRM|nr:sensor histidine kinase [Pectinatus brassicae]MBB5336898.1 signal transduction histidine kinase [Pectinatus brassicae]